MQRNILRRLTFGFEIEGKFKKALLGLKGSFKQDGSVKIEPPYREVDDFINVSEGHGDNCQECSGDGSVREECNCDYDTLDCRHTDDNCECNPDNEEEQEVHHAHVHDDHNEDCYIRPCDSDDDYHYRTCEECDGTGKNNSIADEYASPVFKSLPSLLAELKLFEGKDYLWDYSCGLHLHVGMKKEKWKALWNAAANMAFLTMLYGKASNFCAHQRHRLLNRDDMYFKFWSNPFDLIRSFNHQYRERNFEGGPSTKFRFIRFHEIYHTLEFRFLTPCEHRMDNVLLTLSMLTDYLGRREDFTKSMEASTLNNTTEMDLVREVKERSEACAI